MYKIFFAMALLFGVSFSTVAQAQDIGFLFGVHNTSADFDTPTIPDGSASDVMGFRAGPVYTAPFNRQLSWRLGVLYVTRPGEFQSLANDVLIEAKFAYVDVPFLFQYNFNKIFSAYAGPVASILVSKKTEQTTISTGAVVSSDDQNAKSFVAQAQVGVNVNLKMLAMDFYYERGFGTISDPTPKDYSVFGANLIFWFRRY